MRRWSVHGLILGSVLLASCGGGGNGDGSNGGGGPSPTTYTVSSGVAQKGPFAKGSTVTVQELDSKLVPTGKQYSYQVASDLGTFAPSDTFTSRYVAVTATGNYFDEVANTTSTSPVTLTAVGDLSTDSVLNVNVLTTVESLRIQSLVQSGTTFAAARSQAESEALAVFHIANVASSAPFGMLDISKGRDGDKILAAISSIFAYGNTPDNLKTLILKVQSDLAVSGRITNTATAATLAASAKALNPSAVASNLNAKYASAGGVSFTTADISNWLDQSGSGIVGKFQFQVAGATQASSFTFPSFVTDPYAGSTLSVSTGQLAVNGAPVTGSVVVKSGDVVSVSAPAGAFPNGVLTAYLLTGNATRIAMVSFISGLSSIRVTSSSTVVPVGVTQQFKATGTFADGSTADLTNGVTWTSSTPAIATVDAKSGLVLGVAAGQSDIIAASGTASASLPVVVPNATLQSLAIAPAPFTTGVGIARQMTATGTLSTGDTVNLSTNATWTTSDVSIATVTGGLVSGVAPGSATVTAKVGAISGTATLNVNTHTWNPAGSLNDGHYYGTTATLLPNGSVLSVGGESSAGGFGSPAELYDPVADKWSLSANITAPRTYHTATLLSNGKVIVAGGLDTTQGVNAIASVEIYDPAADKWSAAATMSTARQAHTATALQNGKVLVAGGNTKNADPNLATVEIYDPAADKWSPAASMTSARSRHTATLLPNGKVLVIGGRTYDANGTYIPAGVEIYDPAANTWTAAANTARHRDGHTATLLSSGKVLVVAGADVNVKNMSDAELYDPSSNTWSAAGDSGSAVIVHTATLLPNGTVIMAGGQNDFQQALATVKIYDPAANAWTAGPGMLHARAGFVAVLLPNGALLAVGGEYSGKSSELYW
jgi:N-acetylneuraminic acid mutarotase